MHNQHIIAEKLYNTFKNKIEIDNDILNKKCAIACSGGIDSVFLTILLWYIFSGKNLLILHYNHNTRGQENDTEYNFVYNLSKILKIDFVSEKRQQIGHDTEENLRNARYKFFQNCCKQHNIEYLFLAHHADDVIETMLMRIASGSSAIASPKKIQKLSSGIILYRPLLHINKAEIVKFCTENNINWCEDSSNSESFYLRNRIRNITQNFDSIFVNRNWRSGFLSIYQQITDDNAYFDKIINNYDCSSDTLNLSDINDPAILRRVIKKWLKNTVISKSTFDILLRNIINRTDTTLSINSTTNIKYCHECLIITNNPSQQSIELTFYNWSSGTLFLPNGYQLTKKLISIDIANIKSKTNHSNCVFINTNLQNLNVRTYQNGDKYQPINCKFTKKIKDIFSDKHIATNLRHSLPVLTDTNGNIIWVPNLPQSEISRINTNDKYALEITCTKS